MKNDRTMPPAPLLVTVIWPMSPMAVNVVPTMPFESLVVPPAVAVMGPMLPLGSKASTSGGGFDGGSGLILPGAVKIAFSIAVPPFDASAVIPTKLPRLWNSPPKIAVLLKAFTVIWPMSPEAVILPSWMP